MGTETGSAMKLEVPETFDDVAVDFSIEEWKMLSKEEKELHREVMVQNFEYMVSVGYDIPVRTLLLLLDKPRDVPFNVIQEDVIRLRNDFTEAHLIMWKIHYLDPT
ncbi:protein ZNF738-like isoform X4 [Protopterus annectens]|uniref:protein ZNF738-like isoform X4 n=1 Tax=Protopterus annectens TaxID=7888 RepID=UPI001CF99EE5|nr:protein ZNF738-like isoform X4 [Protopterus annectens]